MYSLRSYSLVAHRVRQIGFPVEMGVFKNFSLVSLVSKRIPQSMLRNTPSIFQPLSSTITPLLLYKQSHSLEQCVPWIYISSHSRDGL